jgi:hypothetical protein
LLVALVLVSFALCIGRSSVITASASVRILLRCSLGFCNRFRSQVYLEFGPSSIVQTGSDGGDSNTVLSFTSADNTNDVLTATIDFAGDFVMAQDQVRKESTRREKRREARKKDREVDDDPKLCKNTFACLACESLPMNVTLNVGHTPDLTRSSLVHNGVHLQSDNPR